MLILRFTEREVRLGGAANAAHNVHALGAAGPADRRARAGRRRRRGRWRSSTRRACATDGIVARAGAADAGEDAHHGGRLPGHAPAGGAPGPRAGRRAAAAVTEARCSRGSRRSARRADAIVVSDYGYGTVTPRGLRAVLELARARRVPVTRGQPLRAAAIHGRDGGHAERGRAGGSSPAQALDDERGRREGRARGARAPRRAAAPGHARQPGHGAASSATGR